MSAPDGALDWRRARAAFEEACELAAGEREAFLARLDREDPALCQRVARLLAADAAGDDFLEPALPSSALLGLEGRDVGGFRVLRVLAEGGMGTVYEAEQEHPRRRVALKTMRAGLTSPQSRRRFQYEGELLARLRHPNIAQVLGAGVLELEGQPGLPWLALELVESARPITALSDDESIPLEKRLLFFLTTCDAVHHAHLRGVLHRDLKGANVLVDGEGHVKVIDFGIARALGDDGPDVTRSGEVVGTLASMAPEQLGGHPGEVDARTDVYALGVLLHQLVCGAPPFALNGLSLAEAARVVEGTDPTPPSRVRRSLPSELDWIVARALAKNPGARYAAVSELAADVKRLLADEPVQAGPPSTVYRLKKYYRRHRLTVVAAVGALLALVTGLVGTSIGLVQAHVAAEEARLAEQDAKRSETAARLEALLAGQLFDFFQAALAAPNPVRFGLSLTMLEFLQQTATGVDARFAEQPLVAGLLHRTIGRSFHGLGDGAQALRHLERAVELLGAIDEPAEERQARRELALALSDLSTVCLTEGDHERAEQALERSEELLRSAGELDELRAAQLASKRGVLRLEQGRIEEALERLRWALAVMPAGGNDALGAASSLGGALHRAGRSAEAIEVFRAALASARDESDPRIRVYLRNNFAMALQESGQSDAAMAALEELLPEQEALFGPDHPDVSATRNNLAALLYLQGSPGEAIPLWNASLAVLEHELQDEHPVLQTLRVNVGTAELDHGDPARGEQLLRGVWELRRKTLGRDDERTLKVQFELARSLRKLASLDEALELAEDAAYRFLEHHGERHVTLPVCELLRAEILADAGDDEEALETLQVLRDDVVAGRRDRSRMSLAALEERIQALSDAR